MKNPLTPAGIEPATFRFVVQHLNHCATAVPSVENAWSNTSTPFHVSMESSLITDSDFYFMLRNAVKYAGDGIVEWGWRYSSTDF